MRRLRFVTALSPDLDPFYRVMAARIGQRLGVQVKFIVAPAYREFAEGDYDVGLLCGLAFVYLVGDHLDTTVGPQPLLAPVPSGRRYQGRPVYFSEVLVRPGNAHSLQELRTARWAYNEPWSWSGRGVVDLQVAALGWDEPAFHRTGSHRASLRALREGVVDATAVDSHLLDVLRLHEPALVDGLQTVALLGPHTIQPIVAAPHVPLDVRRQIRAAIMSLPLSDAHVLAGYGVARFAPIDTQAYASMRAAIAGRPAVALPR